MAINKNHPKYSEYVRKCYALWDRYMPLIEAEEERQKIECPNWRNCLDALETAEKKRLYTKMNQELKMLQNEYSCLFLEEE